MPPIAEAPPNIAPAACDATDPVRPFAALVDDSADAIARIGPDGCVQYANRRLGRLFDRDPGDFVGASIRWFGLPVHLVLRYRRALRTALRKRIESTFAFALELEGQKRHFVVRVVPEFDGDRVVSALAITRDHTERFAIEQQRDALLLQEQSARAKAESATRARDQFLSIVSHELRSPLNGIQSWSHVLENQLGGPDRANPVALRALEGIRAGIDQQVRLIEHLIDATLSMTGTLEIVEAPLVLRDAIEAAVADVRGSAVGKDLALYVDMQLSDERMNGDAQRVKQIFGHLLSNALKFTPHGGSVWVTARRKAAGAVVTVRDSGRGLADGFASWLFEPFSHADGSNTRRAGGLGLGLALARRLVELHGGRIEAESAGPHLGSTFTVSLPLEERRLVPRSVAANDGAVATSALAGISALIVDDQLEAREALCALLTQFGADVQAAPGSRAAVALLVDGVAKPDVVICDIAMPDEDGYGFVKRLRDFERSRSTAPQSNAPQSTPSPSTSQSAPSKPDAPQSTAIPVIALSAFAVTDRRGVPGPDFDAYLTKPVDPPQLLATLYRLAVASRRLAGPSR